MPIEFTDDDVNNATPFNIGKVLNYKENTVNVVEIIDGAISISSFKENAKGNNLAESLFAHMAKENGVKAEHLISHIEDGSYEDGTYKIYIVHSS